MLITETNKAQPTSSHNGDAKLVSPTKNKVKEFSFLKKTNLRKITNWSFGYLNQNQVLFSEKFQQVKIGTFLTRSKDAIKIQDTETYRRVTIKLYGNGIKIRDEVKGKEIGTKSQFLVKDGQFLLSRIDARNGAFAIATKEIDGAIVTNDFPVYDIDRSLINPNYFSLLISTKHFADYFQGLSSGTTNRQRMNETDFLEMQIPLPPIATQEKLVADYNAKMLQAEQFEAQAKVLEQEIETYLLKELGIKIEQAEKKKGLQITSFKSLERWDFDYLDANKTDIFASLEKAKFSLQNIGYAFNFVSRSWSKKSHIEKYFNYIEIGAINSLIGITKAEKIEKSNAPSRATQIVKTNDLILGLTRPNLKRFAIVNSKYDNFVCSSGFQVIEQSGTYNLEFLLEFLKSEAGIKQFEAFMTGALYPAITTKQLKAMKIPIPPLKIQNKIVKHINTLKAEIKTLNLETKDLRNKAKGEFESELFEM